jgi:UDP:flavonoid glycosyltransferase YjiC (YdhE family)
MGDYTLVCDDIEFLDMKSSKELPLENYIGPILTDGLFKNQDKQRDYDIEKHLKRSGKFILLSMGSRTDKEIFLKILHALNKTYYNVIAVYTSVLKEEDLPVVNDNILLKKFVPSMTKLNKIVDLVIIHGGRGTVYTAAYSGKPVIGIPNIHEQQFNLDCLVRHRMAIRLSKKYFNEKKFLKAVEKIFTNYDFYLKNAQMLSNKLPKHEGDINAAKKIVEILKKEGIT